MRIQVPTADGADGWLRFTGAALAFLLSLTTASLLLVVAASLPTSWADVRLWLLLAALAAGVGGVVGAFVGWHMAAAAVDPDRSLARVVWTVTWRAILVGALVLAGSLLVGATGPDGDLATVNNRIQLGDLVPKVFVPIGVRAGWALTALAVGLILFTIPAAVVVAPIATVWTVAMRRRALARGAR
jgi:hypothetical protein